MDYSDLLTRSWKIVWTNKYLLVLGFLAALGSGGGRSTSSYRTGSSEINSTTELAETVDRFLTQYGTLLIAAACIGFLLSVTLWLLRLAAQSGLIHAVAELDAGESMSLKQALSFGLTRLSRMVGVNVVMYGPFTVLGLALVGGTMATVGAAVWDEASRGVSGMSEAVAGTFALVLACVGCLFCIAMPLIFLVSLIYPFAQRGVVIEDLGVMASIRHGWQILKGNVADILLLVLLFFVISIVFGVLSLAVLLPLGFLALGPSVIGILSGGSLGVPEIAMLTGGGICLGLVGTAINSIMISFRSAAVTLAYQQFAHGKA